MNDIGKAYRAASAASAVQNAAQQFRLMPRLFDQSMGSEMRRLQETMNVGRTFSEQLARSPFEEVARQLRSARANWAALSQVSDSAIRQLVEARHVLVTSAAEMARIGAAFRSTYADLTDVATQINQETFRDWLASAQDEQSLDASSMPVAATPVDARLDRLDEHMDVVIHHLNGLTQTVASAGDKKAIARNLAMDILIGLLLMVIAEIWGAQAQDELLKQVTAAHASSEESAQLQVDVTIRLARLEKMQAQLIQIASSYESELDRAVPSHEILAPTTLRRAPGGQAVGCVDSGQTFLLMGKQGRWVEIRYTDPRTGQRQVGWILKKHSQPLYY